MADYQLEIHHIDVRGGDATLIICNEIGSTTNVYSVLVDTGSAYSGWKKLQAYMTNYYPKLVIDLLVISHYHDDHVKGITSGKLFNWLNVKSICDIGWKKDECYPENVGIHDEKFKKAPRFVRTYTKTMKAANNLTKFDLRFIDTTNYEEKIDEEENITIEFKKENNQSAYRPTSIELISGSGYFMDFYSAKGMLFDGTNVIDDQKSIKNIDIDANDLSISFVLYHRSNNTTNFSYFSGGDLSGDPSFKEYYNLEGPVLKLITASKNFPNGFDVIKASHHGSDRNNHIASTTNQTSNPAPGFLNTLKPSVIIVPCNRDKNVPGADFIENRLASYFASNTNAKAYFLNNTLYDGGKKRKPFRNAFINLLKTYSANINVVESGAKKNKQVDLESEVTAIIATHATDKSKITPPYTGTNVTKKLDKTSYHIYFNADALKQISNTNVDDSDNDLLDLPIYLDSLDIGLCLSNYDEQYKFMVNFFTPCFNNDKSKNSKYDVNFKLFKEKCPSLANDLKNVTTKDDFDTVTKNNWTNALGDLFKDLYAQSFNRYELKDFDESYEAKETTLCNLLFNNPMQVEFNLIYNKKNSKENTVASFDYSLYALNQNKTTLSITISDLFTKVNKIKKKLTKKRSETLTRVTDQILKNHNLIKK